MMSYLALNLERLILNSNADEQIDNFFHLIRFQSKNGQWTNAGAAAITPAKPITILSIFTYHHPLLSLFDMIHSLYHSIYSYAVKTSKWKNNRRNKGKKTICILK
jgi:hypothetical protein